QRGLLTVGPDEWQQELQFGFLPPLTEMIGVQRRLKNLGFLKGQPSGRMDDATKDAIAAFQGRIGLEATGKFDDVTRGKLREIHDEVSQFPRQEGPAQARGLIDVR